MSDQNLVTHGYIYSSTLALRSKQKASHMDFHCEIILRLVFLARFCHDLQQTALKASPFTCKTRAIFLL